MTISSSPLWKIHSQRSCLLRQRLLVPTTTNASAATATRQSRRFLGSSWWNVAGTRHIYKNNADLNEVKGQPSWMMRDTGSSTGTGTMLSTGRRQLGGSLRQPSSCSVPPSILSSSILTANKTASTTHKTQSSAQQRRQFHATSKQDILPVIIVGAALVIGRYSWRAMKRMDTEWEDYEWRLQQWEKANRDAASSLASTKFPDGTVAVDVGTLYVKLAHNGKTVLGTREGARATFAGVVNIDQDIMPDSNNNNNNNSNTVDEQLLVGPRAWERYWDISVAHPKRVVMARNTSSAVLLSHVVRAALQDALERASIQPKNMRPVVTVPVPIDNENDHHIAMWQEILSSSSAQNQHPEFWHNQEDVLWIPEPVAAVWGAQLAGDLPLHDMDAKPLLVIDVGGDTTSVSVVQKDVVQASVTLDFGGNQFVTALLDHALESSSAGEKFSSVRNDGMSWQRLVAAAHAAVCELNTHSQVHLQVPYLSMDVETRQPLHLDVKVSRSVVEQKVTDTILTDSVLKHDQSKGERDFLSPYVPVVPHHFSSLWMSVMTQLLTRLSMIPTQLAYVLVVGGGAKQKLFEASVQECFATFQTKVVLPEVSRRAELVALGASSVLPKYDYDKESGLLRREDESGEGENRDHWHK